MSEAPKEYVIEHIADLATVPPEHLIECMDSLRLGILQLQMLRAAAADHGAGDQPAPRVMMPRMVYVADGITRSTVRMDDGDFVISQEKKT